MLFLHLGMHRFYDHDRIVHHHADRQHSAKSVIKLIDMPNSSHEEERANQRYGTASVGINVERKSPRNRKHDQSNQYECFEQVMAILSRSDASKNRETS